MRNIILASMLSFFGLMGTANAGLIYSQSATAGHTDYFSFSYGGGALDIDVWGNGYTGGPNLGIDDIYIGLFVDDGSPEGALTGALLGLSDDSNPATGMDGSTSWLDSYLSFADLASGSYVLAVDHCCVGETGLRNGSTGSLHGEFVDYQITFSNDVSTDVPEPGTLALLSLGLVAIGFSRKRKYFIK